MYQRSYTQARVLLAVFLCGIFLPGLCKAAPPIQISWAPQNPGRGQLTVNMDGYSKTFLYGENDTAASLAAAIGGTLSLDSASPVWARGERDGSVTMRLRRAAGTDLSVCLTPQGSSGCPGAPGTQITTDKTAILPPLTPSMTLGCTPNPLQSGNELTCTTQTPSGATGGVTFYLDGNLFGSTQPTPSGVSIAKTTQSLPNGLHTATAGYAKSLFYPAAFSLFNLTVQGGSGGGGGGSNPGSGSLYSFEVTEFAANGNINAYTDTVNGKWTIGYDSLNRISSATQTQVSGKPALSFAGVNKQEFCWTYDDFGNRTKQAISPQSLGADCEPAASADAKLTKAFYDSNNRVTAASGAPAGYAIDDAGNVKNDGSNEYLYDAEGKLCASHNFLTGKYTGYLYDADGRRSAKGNLTSFTSCDLQANGFSMTNEYIVGQDGEPLTELDGAGKWLHTNAYADGLLVATYDTVGLHFNISDVLGTRRVQTNYAGLLEKNCSSAAFGDLLSCTGTASDATSPTELHFTGKERDSETGLDYFEARTYGSDLGRFLSPDVSDGPEALPFADFTDPQSLNLYAYALNNPSTRTDPDGHETCPDGTQADACATAKPEPKFDTDSAVEFVGNIARAAQDVFTQGVDQISRIMHTPGGAQCFAMSVGAGALQGSRTGAATGTVVAGVTGPETAGVGLAAVPIGTVAGAIGGGAAGAAAALTGCPGGAADGGSGSGGGNTGGGSNAKAATKVSDSQANKIAQQGGYKDAHDLKRQIVGARGSQYDMYKQPNGDIELFRKGGLGSGIETGINVNH